MNIPSPGDEYRHFKGNRYIIDCIAIDTETEKPMVVYHRVNNNDIWVRPLDNFMSEVDHEKYPDVRQKYRFMRIKKWKEMVKNE